jgi:hypothetical protein
MKKKKFTKKELAYIKKLMAGGMDRTRAEWYLNAMQTWTKEDYKKYTEFHREMLGIEDEDDENST